MILNSHSSGSLLTFEDNLPGKHVPSEFSFLYDTADGYPPNKDISPFADSDESVNGSNPLSPENMTVLDPPPLDLDDSVRSSNTSNSVEPKQMHLQTPRRSIRLLNFIGDHLHRMVIPLGPRFQADVPDWTGPGNSGNLNGSDADSENSRWLGTRIWPMEGRSTEITAGRVGKGRPDCCSCVSPGSADCIKHHILEERLRLQSDLAPAFFSWKFDEMGEVISKSWTLKDQQSFQSLVKMYPLSSGKNFLKHASKCFPSKSKENILSYYFNVFIPRHMSSKTRSSLEQIDSDDDEVEGNGSSAFMGSSKDVKTRFLRRRS
ncbi:hypothetical protein F0562_016228 [Nyssa sinensis]|uniref:ELM2 domain-containing protein n=1 Tax=Nyssa sinensis TaxID=561372 RepID=A0A5J4ZMW3_9ASTE|nr:hypothetical protein F0562_016228 [Nyssa sinensis]